MAKRNCVLMTAAFAASSAGAAMAAAGKKVQFTLEGKDNPMITSLKVVE